MSIAAVTAVAVLAIGLLGGHLWVAARLNHAIGAVVVSTQCLADISRITRDVHTFHRLGNIMVAEPSRELAAERAEVERRLVAEVRDAAARPLDPVESKIASEARRRVDEYVRYRHQLEAEVNDVAVITSRARRSLDAAIGTLDSWGTLEEQRVAAALSASHRLRPAAALVAGGGALLLIGAMVGAGIGLRNYALRPIVAMQDAIERLRAGDPNARAPEIGARETVEVARALNDLTGELGRRRESQLAFLAGVAHDLRNPLAALKMGLHTVEHSQSEARRARTIAVLDRQLDRLARMVEDMLDATRIEAGRLELQMQEWDLRQGAWDVVRLYAPTSPMHHFVVSVPDEPVVVQADPLRIEQVLSNLVSNAVKFSPSGGPVEITLERQSGQAVLSVADQGMGIAPDRMRDLFTPFQQRSSLGVPGAGLGLSVVRRIVDAHGGSIEVESEPGAGATFRVRLALGSATRAPAPGAPDRPAAAPS